MARKARRTFQTDYRLNLLNAVIRHALPHRRMCGWFATFVHLAGEDITKLPQVERTHLETALAWLAYEQDRALLEKQKMNL